MFTTLEWKLFSVGLMVLPILVKLVFYSSLRKKSIKEFARSFNKWYDDQDHHNAKRNHRKVFMKVSNFCLPIFWVGSFLVLYFFLIAVVNPFNINN